MQEKPIDFADIFPGINQPQSEEEKKKEALRKLKAKFPGLFIPKK